MRDMTKGRILPIIMRFCVPILLGTIIQQFYNMADTTIVGRYIGAEEPLAAVGTTGSLNFLVLGFVIGICAGVCIPISRKFGAGDIKEMRRYAANTFYLCGFFAVLLTALTIPLTRQLLNLIDVPEQIINLSHSYIIIIFAGIPATMACNLLASLLRALGDSKAPLYFLAIGSVINIGMDLLFIVVFNMGVKGAGWATVMSQVIAALLCFFYIKRNYPILRFTKEELRFSFPHIKKLLAAGLPMGLQFSITAIGALILTKAINGLGEVLIISSVTTGNRISMLFFQPMEALGLTMATFCGQNLGAKALGRIKKGVRISMSIQIIYCLAAGAVLWFFGKNIAAVFIGGEVPQILENVQFQLRVLGATYVTLGVLFIMRNTLQGLGYSFMAMSAGVCELLARVFVAFVLVERFGFYGVCFSGGLSWLLADIVLIPAYFIIMKKLKKRISNSAVGDDAHGVPL
ncbi:MAG: MATE family efflux transporter [Oscillospiraceae bacterium]|nr:MATE family efflux transporter [Oscillospiraceae bacterium]